MKVKIACDKRYGGIYDKNGKVSSMDCDFFNSGTLQSIVNNYKADGLLIITEDIVDYYNNENSRIGRKSFKTAENIAKQIKKLYKDK